MTELSSTSPPKFTKKVIAFVDIVGFSNMVKHATDDNLPALLALTEKLGKPLDAAEYHRGPILCPDAPYLDRNLDFKITQVSDCVIISAELSPAGAISVLHYCQRIAVRMIQAQHLCRGAIVTGPIYHDGLKIIGEGYQRAFHSEGHVTAMSSTLAPDSEGGPFIEVAPDLLAYVAGQKDKCVHSMLKRLTHTEGGMTAIYPFHSLAESHACTVDKNFDPAKWRSNVNAWRESWSAMRSDLSNTASRLQPRHAAKWHHVITGIDHILSRADDRIRQLDEFIARGYGPPEGLVWGAL